MRTWMYALPLVLGALLRSLGFSNDASFWIVVGSLILLAVGIFIHYKITDGDSGHDVEFMQSANDGRQYLQTSVGTLSISATLLPPINNQIMLGLKEGPSSSGSIFDAYVYGYFFGYINRFMENSSQTSIDSNWRGASLLFSALFGDVDAGDKILGECLEARHFASTEISSSFHRGQEDGVSDLDCLATGNAPQRLATYLASR